jgi:hypothetical protein
MDALLISRYTMKGEGTIYLMYSFLVPWIQMK